MIGARGALTFLPLGKVGLAMTSEDERFQKTFAKAMVAACVRRGELEGLHSGISPVTHAGDYSDVYVVDADGRRIPWADVSRIDQNEMKALLIGVVNRTYTFLVRTFFTFGNDAAFAQAIDHAAVPWTTGWDEPEYLPQFLMPVSSEELSRMLEE